MNLIALTLLGALLPDMALEPEDPADHGRVEVIKPGPCGADSALRLTVVEAEQARALGQSIPLENVRGKRVKLTARAQLRGGKTLPALWVKVSVGNPPRELSIAADEAKEPCKPMLVTVDVPLEATAVSMGVSAREAGLLEVEPLKLEVLGDAAPISWERLPLLGEVGSQVFNDGIVKSRWSGSGFVQSKLGEWTMGSERVVRDGDGWLVELGRAKGRFGPPSHGGEHRLSGRWTFGGRSEEAVIEWSADELTVSWGAEVRRYKRTIRLGRLRDGCASFREVESRSLVELCGVWREIVMPQVAIAFARELLPH